MLLCVCSVLLVMLGQALHLQHHLQSNDQLKNIQIKLMADIERIKQELTKQYGQVQTSNDLDAKILIL